MFILFDSKQIDSGDMLFVTILACTCVGVYLYIICVYSLASLCE